MAFPLFGLVRRCLSFRLQQKIPFDPLCLIGLLGVLFGHFYINGQIIKIFKKHGLDLPKAVLFGKSLIFCFEMLFPGKMLLLWVSTVIPEAEVLGLSEIPLPLAFLVSFLSLLHKVCFVLSLDDAKTPLWMKSGFSLPQWWLLTEYQIVDALVFVFPLK